MASRMEEGDVQVEMLPWDPTHARVHLDEQCIVRDSFNGHVPVPDPSSSPRKSAKAVVVDDARCTKDTIEKVEDEASEEEGIDAWTVDP